MRDAPKRLKVGQALQRWIDGDSRAWGGRITFQLEMVYSVKTNAAGDTVRYGPYGPYWYMYYYVQRGVLRPSNLTRTVSRYVGKPEDVDPESMTPQQVAALIRG